MHNVCLITVAERLCIKQAVQDSTPGDSETIFYPDTVKKMPVKKREYINFFYFSSHWD